MSIGEKLKDLGRKTQQTVETARLKTRSFLRELDSKAQAKQASRDLKRSLDAESAKEYLSKEKKRQEQETLIKKAKDAKFNASFGGRVSRVVKQYKPVSKGLRPATATRQAVVSSNKKGVVRRSDVLRVNR